MAGDSVTLKSGAAGSDIPTSVTTDVDGNKLQRVVATEGIYPDGKLLFNDNFSDGFCGWTELYETASSQARPMLSMSGFPSLSGKYSLRVGTEAVASSSNGGQATAIKRLTRIKDSGYLVYDLWWAWGSTLAPLAPLNIDFWIDTQNRAGSQRSNYFFRWQIRDPSTGAALYQWAIVDGAGNNIYVPGAVYAHPFNENKQNYMYCRFRVDLNGGYKDLWVYDDHYDVSGLGGGTGSRSTVANFNGGLNFAVTVVNRSSSNLCQAWVDLDKTRGWYE